MSTHTATPHQQSFLKDYGFALGALVLGIIAVVVGLLLSYVIGGLLGLVTWMVAGGARSVATSNDGKGYAMSIVAAVLGGLAVVMLLVGQFLT